VNRITGPHSHYWNTRGQSPEYFAFKTFDQDKTGIASGRGTGPEAVRFASLVDNLTYNDEADVRAFFTNLGAVENRIAYKDG
jgi:hypothetical protein